LLLLYENLQFLRKRKLRSDEYFITIEKINNISSKMTLKSWIWIWNFCWKSWLNRWIHLWGHCWSWFLHSFALRPDFWIDYKHHQSSNRTCNHPSSPNFQNLDKTVVLLPQNLLPHKVSSKISNYEAF